MNGMRIIGIGLIGIEITVIKIEKIGI